MKLWEDPITKRPTKYTKISGIFGWIWLSCIPIVLVSTYLHIAPLSIILSFICGLAAIADSVCIFLDLWQRHKKAAKEDPHHETSSQEKHPSR
ncbi:hypothetical protein KTE19_02240 [Lentilactobacillus sp. IMAU92037]|uniref:hypothetical protein n=1 Tax=Lentilactobacillus TaxID=2767893 RepID=UPI001C2B9C45|nr:MULTISPECIES: hypothetical protein [Lentilactobacillus]MBV0929545.1 hypothetical protein [Lentilactobacillus dabitei]MDM7515119.1 hypothetical protein [Lentilactobacillus sp. TOM.63]